MAQVKACQNILDTVMFFNLQPEQIRNDLDKPKTQYYAIPTEEFDDVFNVKIIEAELIRCINEFNPTVIFSLDNEMGGYGHAEHVLISQLIVDLAKDKSISPSYIYQNVYTKHMETTIMKRHSDRMKSWGFAGDEWEYAKKTYKTNGMPEPDVQVVITNEAKLKMDYLMSYNERERKTIGFFMPQFYKFKAEEYFKIFDREFFRIIEV